MIYFTSDSHFFYGKSQPRVGEKTFNTPKEKNDFLIERWNDRVGEKDIVYILGDFSNGNGEETNQILRRLKGEKYLIRGNNDKYLKEPDFEAGHFQWVKDYFELHALDTKWCLFHFPMEVWSGYAKDRFHLHGHLHRRHPIYEEIRRYEVGVDAHEGYPVSIDEIYDALKEFHNLSRRMPGVE